MFRNNVEINSVYKKKINGIEKHKEVFTKDENQSFDEWAKEGINELFKNYKIRMYDEIIFSDIYIGKFAFYPYQLMDKERYKNHQHIFMEKGALYQFYIIRVNYARRKCFIFTCRKEICK